MQPITVIDSHTEGEPTRVVLDGAPDLGEGSICQRAGRFRTEHDTLRRAIIAEPRGHEAIVGALLLEPVDPRSAAAVIFFNNVGTLPMCVHGAIGVTVTLAALDRIQPGSHTLETPAGNIVATLHDNGEVSIENVASFRQREAVALEVEQLGTVHGDIAWGGNWFFLIQDHGLDLERTPIDHLRAMALNVRAALDAAAIHGVHRDPESGEETFRAIDHIEFFGPPARPDADSRNFVLCPGGEFDRSPCGTGTSAKIACLAADNALAENEAWVQESIIGSRFVCRYRRSTTDPKQVIPTITGGAWITARTQLHFDPTDPFVCGIVRP
jgi:4-hydroxyproline epimerase